VIVVDQASSDGSRELAQTIEVPFELRLVEQDAKYGISVARNAGIEASDSSFVLLLDADLIVDPKVVAAHVELLSAHPGILSCGRVLPYRPAYRTFIEQIANPDAGLDRGDTAEDLPFYQGFGGHISFSKETFSRIGSFDTQLKGFEDIDFAYRAIQTGCSILNNKKAVSYHNHPRTLEERLAQARAYNRMLPILLDRYPEISKKVPIFKDLEPIQWQADNMSELIEKFKIRVFGIPAVRWLSFSILALLERYRRMPFLVRGLYWRLLIGSWYLGFRDGMAQLRARGQ